MSIQLDPKRDARLIRALTTQRAQEGPQETPGRAQRARGVRGLRSPTHDEHSEQVALFAWAACYTGQLPALALLYAIPNGGKRDKVTAARLKREGVKAGIPDMCLPIARDGQHGIYIELKAGRGVPTLAQREWGTALSAQGYAWYCCYGWQMAAYAIIRYLGLRGVDYGLPWQ